MSQGQPGPHSSQAPVTHQGVAVHSGEYEQKCGKGCDIMDCDQLP